MSERTVNDADIATVRGVRNCGKHHEENATAPAVLFAQKCDTCAGQIFVVIWNQCRESQRAIMRQLENR